MSLPSESDDHGSPDASFLFAVCQNGFEKTCKEEILAGTPNLRFAFSRPGLLTFKSPNLKREPDLRSTFTRTLGFSLGVSKIDNPETLANEIEKHVANKRVPSPFDAIHVWNRRYQNVASGDQVLKSFHANEQMDEVIGVLKEKFPETSINSVPNTGSVVLDLIHIDENSWLIGYHRADQIAQRWPGGVPRIKVPEPMISRAYLKTYEGILWSRMPIRPGDFCVEVGSAPGGSSQALLELDCVVIAIDPADMDESLMKNERLIHHRKRGREVKKSELAEARWLFADANVAWKETLQIVEDIVTNEKVHIKGMLLTLKLSEKFRVAEIPTILAKVKSWGYKFVKSRQLAFNRNEICVMALKQKAIRRT